MERESHPAGSDSLFERYCLPGGRYKKLLSGSFMCFEPAARMAFGTAILADARGMADATLEALFNGDWRECLTASWIAGFDRRYVMRPAISARLTERRERYVGKGLCFALARFSTHEDAQTLVEYLANSLADRGFRSVQPWALGALMAIEERLGMDLSSQFLRSGGPWEQWVGEGFVGNPEPEHWKFEVREWCGFAESVELEFANGDE